MSVAEKAALSRECGASTLSSNRHDDAVQFTIEQRLSPEGVIQGRMPWTASPFHRIDPEKLSTENANLTGSVAAPKWKLSVR